MGPLAFPVPLTNSLVLMGQHAFPSLNSVMGIPVNAMTIQASLRLSAITVLLTICSGVIMVLMISAKMLGSNAMAGKIVMIGVMSLCQSAPIVLTTLSCSPVKWVVLKCV